MKYPLLSILFTASLTLLLDQASKYWLLHEMSMIEQATPMALFPGFNLVMVWNQGVSFGLFSGLDARLGLIVVSLVICSVLLYLHRNEQQRWKRIGAGAIIGGAIGNVIDRLLYGAVADFFDVYVGTYHWPAFNVADSGIVIGVIILIIAEITASRRSARSDEQH